MKSKLLAYFLVLVAGGLYSLAYPSDFGEGWFPLLFLSLPFFLWKLETSIHLKESLLFILCFNAGLNLVGYYWIPHTLREFGNLPYVISVILGLSFSLILQPHWWLYAIWKKLRPRMKWQSETGVMVTAFVMTMLERFTPQQFPSYVGSPWLHLTPYLGLAPHLGVVAFSFMTFWVCLEAVTQATTKNFRPQVWVCFAVFVLLNAAMPLGKVKFERTLSVRVVQANIGNFLKVSSEKGDFNSYESIARKYQELSITQNGFRPELIVWPETAYSNTFSTRASGLDQIFVDILTSSGAEMLIGGYVQDPTKSPFEIYESIFNSSVLISDLKVKASYHKNILIPFGETLPFGPLNNQIVSVVPAVSLFARGHGTPLMETRSGLRFITPICYEILESNYMRSLLNQWKDNHFIVNHTNDSWYGDTAEPYQHLFLSRWRALEFQLPIVRSTNTGITSVIYPDGSESKRLGIGQTDILDVKLPISPGHNTIYQLYGAFPILAIFIILLGVTVLRERSRAAPEQA
ncbi:MAG TPA: apolipoprotein N-acyltransferase [Bacteriovoracaceae bacterium]|nr:apolipoprotein N-acyltransferase [Bacteriovoracaceae bacterium]